MQNELRWLLHEVWRSILRPREFARRVASEEHSIASVVVVVACGAALALAADILIVFAAGGDRLRLVVPAIIDVLLNGARLAVTVALAGVVVAGLTRVGLTPRVSLEKSYTVIAFALAPFVFLPLLALLLVALPPALPVVLLLVAILLGRALAGLVIGYGAVTRAAVAVLLTLATIGVGALTLGDVVSRAYFAAAYHAPPIAPPVVGVPATGTLQRADTFTIVTPPGWQVQTTGARGEFARFETDVASLGLVRARSGPLASATGYADAVRASETLGLEERRWSRRAVRIGDLVAVDDVTIAQGDGRPILLRQYTAVTPAGAVALVFRYVNARDEQAALAEAASIAATFRLAAP